MSVSTPTRPAAPARPARPVTTVQSQVADELAAQKRRQNLAYRNYILALYEWRRLVATGRGFKTPSGHEPLPLKGDEETAIILGKLKALGEWLDANKEGAPAIAPVPVAPVADGEAAPPKRWPLPPKAPQVPCRSCGAPMVFAPTEGGKMAPLNLDGTSHFATCPNADAHRNGAKAKPATAPAKANTTPDVAPHVARILEVATDVGLSHEKGHRVARLAKLNVFLMDNEREAVDSFRDIRAGDEALITEGLRKRVLRWP